MNKSTNCPRLFPLRILSHKWRYLILKLLFANSLRFQEIKNNLHYITSRELSNDLKILQKELLIVHSGKYYFSSQAGKELALALEPLAQWSVDHRGIKYCSLEQPCSHCNRYPQQVILK